MRLCILIEKSNLLNSRGALIVSDTRLSSLLALGCVACVPMDRGSLSNKRRTSCEAAHRAA